MKRSKPIKRGKRPRRQRKGTKAALARLCDKLWSEIVRSRGACEACNCQPPGVILQGAHGFSRRYRGTRWNLLNGFCLCSGCHVSFTHNPLLWDEWLRRAWGEETYSELRRIALKGEKPDMDEIKAKLERCLPGR